jgi:predicted nucleic acid-binding protein
MFLDTSILVEVLRGSPEVVGRVEKIARREALMFSIVQLGELADWSRSNNFDPEGVVDRVKAMASVVGLTEEICLEGSRIKFQQRKAGRKGFSLIGGIIAASARTFEQDLLTKDQDFQGLEGVVLI